jgi:hypothetical protein
MLETAPLVASLAAAMTARPVPLAADQADIAHVVAAAFARPGRDLVAVPITADHVEQAATRVAAARHAVPFRR